MRMRRPLIVHDDEKGRNLMIEGEVWKGEDRLSVTGRVGNEDRGIRKEMNEEREREGWETKERRVGNERRCEENMNFDG